MSGGGLRRRRLGCLAAAETWVSCGCGNGLGFWWLLRRFGFLETAAEARPLFLVAAAETCFLIYTCLFSIASLTSF